MSKKMIMVAASQRMVALMRKMATRAATRVAARVVVIYFP
jgi:hypothetical protein